MNNLLKDKKITVQDGYPSPFLNSVGVYQDGTVPFSRDKNGKLWAIGGHSHMGHIGIFCGNDLTDMKEAYPAQFHFCVGHAEYAFSGIRYPEGVKARGSIWPFGLYICHGTGRFFCFFHNETGWAAKGTAYDAFGLCDEPIIDSDFRHVGLMHSDDEGRNWTFDRWVLTAEKVCFTEKFVPDGVNVKGQPSGEISLGSGDFSLYAPQNDEYMYLFYNILRIDTEKKVWTGCDAYVARIGKRSDGVMPDPVKYYNGSFCEPGTFGKETPIVRGAWHPRVAYVEKENLFLMASAPINENSSTAFIRDYMELRVSKNLIEWSEPFVVQQDGKPFGNHYNAILSYHGTRDPFVITGNEFTALTCHNGTDVIASDFKAE